MSHVDAPHGGGGGKLTTAERSRLNDLEATIERGQEVFIEVGLALAEVHDARLYRDTHRTFEGYLRER